MPHVFGVAGSPRKGATEYAVKEALKAAEEIPGVTTEFYSLKGKDVLPCNHCNVCIRDSVLCIRKDNLNEEFIEPLLRADGVIIGSPVYHMGITAQLAACFHRSRPLYRVHAGALRNKVGGGISLGGTRHGGQETTLLAIANYFLLNEMLATGGYGGCYSGGTLWTKDNRKFIDSDDEVGMVTVRSLGKAVAEAAYVTSLGRNAWEKVKKEIDLQDKGFVMDH